VKPPEIVAGNKAAVLRAVMQLTGASTSMLVILLCVTVSTQSDRVVVRTRSEAAVGRHRHHGVVTELKCPASWGGARTRHVPQPDRVVAGT
jgi:hypothetical protein